MLQKSIQSKECETFITRSVIEEILPIVKTNNVSESSNSIVEMTGYGYTTTSIAAAKTKCSYKSTSPIIVGVGLAGGLYFVEVIKVTKTLSSYRKGDIINPNVQVADDKDTGTKSCGFYETAVGWNASEVIEDGDKVFVGTTYLIHFLYAIGGATIDKYYPCRPENLVWKYESILYATAN